MQAKQFREQQKLGLASQEEFTLDTSMLSKRKAAMSGVAGWQEEPGSDDDFDGDVLSQAGTFAVHVTTCGVCMVSGMPWLPALQCCDHPN